MEAIRHSLHRLETIRRRVRYTWTCELRIEPLIEELNFIKNNAKWGLGSVSALSKIRRRDFKLIVTALGRLDNPLEPDKQPK